MFFCCGVFFVIIIINNNNDNNNINIILIGIFSCLFERFFFPIKLFKQLGLELSCRGLFVVQLSVIASTGKAESKKG